MSYFKFENIGKVLVTCPSYREFEGGLLLLDFKKNNIMKIMSGDCRGISKHPSGHYFLATNSEGILKIDENFKVIENYHLSNMDLHGLKISEEGFIFVAETAHNTIGIYQADPLMRIDELKISNYIDDQNHINDLWIEGKRLFVSMFSLKGGWRNIKGSYDGIIAEYDIENKRLIRLFNENLQFPHSLIKKDEDFYFCESAKMNVRMGNQIIAQLNGFTRGLALGEKHMLIGQSEMRHLDKVMLNNLSVSLDCGVHILDLSSRTSRFVQLPEKQVYEILVVDEADLVINFGNDDEQFFVNPEEWHNGEFTHRWMKNQKVIINIPLNKSYSKITIAASSAFPEDYYSKIFVNNILTKTVQFVGQQQQKIELPLETTEDYVQLMIEVQHLWTPSDYLQTDDQRELGIAIQSIIFK